MRYTQKKYINYNSNTPFKIQKPKLNKETIKAIDDVEKGIGLSKEYDNLDKMWEELGKKE